jgi:hypothetical protein
MRRLPTVRLQLRRSRIEAGALLALYLLALPMPWFAALSWWGRTLIDAGLLLLAARQWRVWRQGPPISLRLLPDGTWALDVAGQELEAQQLSGAYVTAHLVVLPLKLANGRVRRLVLWPDSATADELRRLRAWLRWGQRPAEAAMTTPSPVE